MSFLLLFYNKLKILGMLSTKTHYNIAIVDDILIYITELNTLYINDILIDKINNSEYVVWNADSFDIPLDVLLSIENVISVKCSFYCFVVLFGNGDFIFIILSKYSKHFISAQRTIKSIEYIDHGLGYFVAYSKDNLYIWGTLGVNMKKAFIWDDNKGSIHDLVVYPAVKNYKILGFNIILYDLHNTLKIYGFIQNIGFLTKYLSVDLSVSNGSKGGKEMKGVQLFPNLSVLDTKATNHDFYILYKDGTITSNDVLRECGTTLPKITNIKIKGKGKYLLCYAVGKCIIFRSNKFYKKYELDEFEKLRYMERNDNFTIINTNYDLLSTHCIIKLYSTKYFTVGIRKDGSVIYDDKVLVLKLPKIKKY